MRLGRRLAASVATALALTLVIASVTHGAASTRRVQILDDCDAATFNAVLGPGNCVKDGDVTFEEFIEQLLTMGGAPAWRFSPAHLKIDVGGRIVATNRGGEFHTFTEVAQFGGGCVPEINELLGGLTPVPECGNPAVFGTTGVAPRQRLTTAPLSAGTHRFQCLIHPWQRTTAVAR